MFWEDFLDGEFLPDPTHHNDIDCDGATAAVPK